MKTKLITSLKKNVLLVDNSLEDGRQIKELVDNFDVGYKFLGKLKDLTEEQCWNYSEKEWGYLYLSFLSALEAEGLHLNGNPYGFEPGEYDDEFWEGLDHEKSAFLGYKFDEIRKKWQEAEQNVFSPETLVFVEQ